MSHNNDQPQTTVIQKNSSGPIILIIILIIIGFALWYALGSERNDFEVSGELNTGLPVEISE